MKHEKKAPNQLFNFAPTSTKWISIYLFEEQTSSSKILPVSRSVSQESVLGDFYIYLTLWIYEMVFPVSMKFLIIYLLTYLLIPTRKYIKMFYFRQKLCSIFLQLNPPQRIWVPNSTCTYHIYNATWTMYDMMRSLWISHHFNTLMMSTLFAKYTSSEFS